jgi:group I intron endonuclease
MQQNYLYHTVYRITNNLNGKIYIGAHSTNDLDDNYMGSGKHLRRAYTKHGIKNFSKQILFVYDTLEEAFAKEAEIVNEQFVKDDSNYNIALGGQIPLCGFLGNNHSDETKKRLSETHSAHLNPFFGKKHTDEHRDYISKITSGENNPRYGCELSNELREKIGNSNKGLVWWNDGKTSIRSKTSPGNNWNRGRLLDGLVWWTNGIKSVKSIECPSDGWRRGRTFRHRGICKTERTIKSLGIKLLT